MRSALLFMKIITVCLIFNLSSVMADDDRFTDNGDGTVSDHQLGLMWAKTDNHGDIDWKEANKWVKYTFPYTIAATYDDWRLPTMEELKSLYLKDENYNGYETDCGQNVRIVPQIELTCGWLWTSEQKSVTAKVFNFNRGYSYRSAGK